MITVRWSEPVESRRRYLSVTVKRPEREGVMISDKVIFGLVALLYVAAIVEIFILKW
jgi:hypothetical protein